MFGDNNKDFLTRRWCAWDSIPIPLSYGGRPQQRFFLIPIGSYIFLPADVTGFWIGDDVTSQLHFESLSNIELNDRVWRNRFVKFWNQDIEADSRDI